MSERETQRQRESEREREKHTRVGKQGIDSQETGQLGHQVIRAGRTRRLEKHVERGNPPNSTWGVPLRRLPEVGVTYSICLGFRASHT
jgi:hypothetical protein